MKNILKSILIAFIAFGGLVSCSDSDLAIDTLYNDVDKSGSVLRMLQYPTDIVSITGSELVAENLTFRFEVQEGDGSFTPDFKEVRVFMDSFDDQDSEFPTLDTDGNVIGEFLYETIPASEFTELSEVNGLPEGSFVITTRDLLDNVYGNAVFGGNPSFIVNRFELEMSDGRVWSVHNAGTTLSGPALESPFTRTTIFKIDEGLETKMKVNEDEPTVGEEVTFQIDVKNLDNVNDNPNITMQANLPAGVTYVSDDGGGSYNAATGVFTIGTLLADIPENGSDDKIRLKIKATINAGTAGTDIITTFDEAKGELRNPAVNQANLTTTMVVQN